MLESFAAWILNTYIGDYFGNVNTDQLRMSLKSGEIELERLPLKRDILKHFGLPLEANTGYIGKISIKFPKWHQFTSEPLVITIDKLYLIIKPILNFKYNEEEENRAQQEFKMGQLDTMESQWKALHDDLTEQSSYYSSSYSSWLNYGSSFLNNVVLNVHLKISSVHIRYEDDSTVPHCPFATGVVIRSLTICSTDDQWEPKFVTRDKLTDQSVLYKLIDLESFGCYCDTNTAIFSKLDFPSIVESMTKTLEQNLNHQGIFEEHGYIIAPVNGKCRMKRNCSEMSLKSCQQPRTVIDVQLEQVPVMMTAIQYKHLFDWSSSFQTQKTLWKYRKWRPMIQSTYQQTDGESEFSNVRLDFKPKIWWHFAVNANLEEYRKRKQRFNWHFILHRSNDIVAYHKAYLHYLIYPESFTKEMRCIKDRVENDFTLDEICSIREITFNKADRILRQEHFDSTTHSVQQQHNESTKQSSSYWFFPDVISYLYYNPQPETCEFESVNDEKRDQKGENNQFQRISSPLTSSLDDVFLTRDAIFCQFNFEIRNSSFQLIAFNHDTLMQAQDETFLSSSTLFPQKKSQQSERKNSGANLLLEFEFTQMKIGIDVTNPNAYSCVCHVKSNSRNHLTVASAQERPPALNDCQQNVLLTQNELNQLQLNLNFECQLLNLTLIRAEQAIIDDEDETQRLATARLVGCALKLSFSNDFVSIDGKMDSLEMIDLVTQPKNNKHQRVLSIGHKDQQGGHFEKALSFSLSRQLNENVLRLNVEMASFCYVHSAMFMYELSLCRKCFTDVLEAYFTRSFKERVKAATSEMLRGIVNKNESESRKDGEEEKVRKSSNSRSVDQKIDNQSIKSSSKFLYFLNNQNVRNRRVKSFISSTSPFIDNFKLNVFIRSPVVIFPTSPSSYQVVVFHLGHILLNNHNNSADIFLPTFHRHEARSKKKISSYSPVCSQSNSSYNAEIRDLSIYSLNCMKNIDHFESVRKEETIIPVEELYHCDSFGVPILQRTVIEIFLEKKILFGSEYSSSGKNLHATVTKKTSTTNAPAPDYSHIDGLNLISSVNSIDPLVLPKKFSVKSHLFSSELPSISINSINGSNLEKSDRPRRKPEMVLLIEISLIDLRFSYTDLLMFWHIFNQISSIPQQSDAHQLVMLEKRTSPSISTLDPVLRENLENQQFSSKLSNLLDLGFGYDESLKALALKNGDYIEAAYLLSSSSERDLRQSSIKSMDSLEASDYQAHSSDDNQSQSTSYSTDGLHQTSSNPDSCLSVDFQMNNKKGASHRAKQNSSLLISILSVIEIRISDGSIQIVDDCNQLDLPLLEVGIQDFRSMQYFSLPTVEAHAQTTFYCDYYNSHLSGWEPFIEHCQVSFSLKRHQSRCHLRSTMMQSSNFINTGRLFASPRQKFAIKIDINKMFNINISRTLLDLTNNVYNTWIKDITQFTKLDIEKRSFRKRKPFIPFALRNETGSDMSMFVANPRKMFSFASQELKSEDKKLRDMLPELIIKSNEIVYFDCVDFDQFNSKQKNADPIIEPKKTFRFLRNNRSKTTPLKVYVKVNGWRETFPLSIEREGTFIRHIVSEKYVNQSAILVFDIKLQESAIKVITVRSSLLIKNQTTKTVELKFVNTAMCDGPTSYMIMSDAIFPVPLSLLYARIQLRPCDLGIGTCSTYINWNHVRRFGEVHCSLQICTPITHTSQGSYSKSLAYVVTVQVQRDSMGALIESNNISLMNSAIPLMKSLTTPPSHTITLLPPLQLANRLPHDLCFTISHSSSIAGTIKPGEDHSVHYISPLEPFSIEFRMETFPRSKPLYIEPGAIKNYQTHLDMYDQRGRLLILNAQIHVLPGGQQPAQAMIITIYAPFWIINRSGLPLLFSQESCSLEAAGQSEEHERARSISPLLFSFSDSDAPNYCIMRLGRMTPLMEPRWCNLFCLEKGSFYRRLRVTEYPSEKSSLSLEKIYEFGIDIRNGRDRYSHTKIVTIAPRFQIENLTSFKLEFAQKCLVDQLMLASNGTKMTNNSSLTLSPYQHNLISRHRDSLPKETSTISNEMQTVFALPKSNMPYHWPCSDKPKLLCVRFASIINSLWSGSIDVGSEPSVSFHLNIRDETGHSYFIRVEILLQNATYFIVFTDANSLPPPIRVENFSQVAIEFHQVGSFHRTIVRSNSSVPYALDEPTQPSHITVCAPGGSFSTYDLNSFSPGDTLTYDNFYYLAFEETFLAGKFYSPSTIDFDDEEQLMLMMMSSDDDSLLLDVVASKMLVLDVPEDDLTSPNEDLKPIVLARKERGKRSQLWRIDSNNHIIHEGSSPPSDPPRFEDLGFSQVKFANPQSSSVMVLDVVDEDVFGTNIDSLPLAVRKMHPSRSSTQTWLFTEDGRLRCLKYWNKFVQPFSFASKERQSTTLCTHEMFRSGSFAVIHSGPTECTKSTIPKEQAIMKQKMRKGSGVLSVAILADGPSRVLRIKDHQLSANSRHVNIVHYYGHFGLASTESNSTSINNQSFLMKFFQKTELELSLQINSIGFSIISDCNEEIIFLFMKKIISELICNPAECRLNCVVESFQIDNQLRDCEKDVVLFVSNNLDNLESNNLDTGNGSQFSERPAIMFSLHKLFLPNVDIKVFKNLQISISDLVLNIEEIVLLKVLEFCNYDPVDSEMDEISSTNTTTSLSYHANRNVSSSLSRSTQIFFAYLLIQLQRVKLSVFTSSSKISSFLGRLKKKSGIKLIRFEEALIQLKPFHKIYSLMTRRFLQQSIQEHYRSELRSQAAKILGTVDFLGNPVGFINNLVEGFNELLYEKSLSGLIMNVTHGISDSTAKVTSVLSDSLGSATMDARHQEIRMKIKQQNNGQRSHLVAGTFGLAHGILGGITSVITQTYDGVVNHGGITGLLSGFGKGVLGTFTKPAVGMLDFASSAATAVRDSSRKVYLGPAKRIRLPRTLTIDGRLTTYDPVQAIWQSRFYQTTDFGSHENNEQFVKVFPLSEGHFSLLTTERIFFYHSTLKKRDMASFDDDRMLFEEVNSLKLANCKVFELHILPLDTFIHCQFHEMTISQAKRLIRSFNVKPSCLDISIMLANQDSLCYYIEFQTGSSSSSSSLSIISSQEKSCHLQRPQNLSCCYVFCDSLTMVTKLSNLVNEAKHLQEERKFEISNSSSCKNWKN